MDDTSSITTGCDNATSVAAADEPATTPGNDESKKLDVVERWDVTVSGWRHQGVGERFLCVDEAIKTVLIRNYRNRMPLGLGRRIAQVEYEFLYPLPAVSGTTLSLAHAYTD